MQIDLKYGEGVLRLDVDLPYVDYVLTPRSVSPVPDLDGTICRMLDGPNGLGPILDSASRPCTATVVIDEPTSQTPTDRLLNCMASYLESRCVDPSDTTLLVASSLDGQLGQAEAIDRSRSAVGTNYRVEAHSRYDREHLVELGETPTYRTPVALNRVLMDSELRIGISSIVPDGFTGATGGSASVLPGVAADLTCVSNRRLCMTGPAGMGAIHRPVTDDMAECAEMARIDCILNTVLDWTGTIAQITAGAPACWSEGVDVVRGLSQVMFKKKADIAVISAGGAPYDRTLYRAVDSLLAGMTVVRRNGVIVLVAECGDGVGPEGFLAGISNQTSREGLLNEAEQSFELGMEKANLFWQVLESRRLILCTRLRRSLVEERLHCDAVREPREAVEIARTEVGESTGMLVLPCGSHTVPVQL